MNWAPKLFLHNSACWFLSRFLHLALRFLNQTCKREREGMEIALAVLARGLALVSLPSNSRAVEELTILPGRWEAEYQERAAARCLGFRVISQQESPGGPRPTNKNPNHGHFTTHRITHLPQQTDALYTGKREKFLLYFQVTTARRKGWGCVTWEQSIWGMWLESC